MSTETIRPRAKDTRRRSRPGADRRLDIPTDPNALIDVQDVMHLHNMHHLEAVATVKAAGGFVLGRGRRLRVRRGDLDAYIERLVRRGAA